MINHISEKEYRDLDALHYSLLSQLRNKPSAIYEEKDFTDGIMQGTALDTILFQGREAYNSRFAIMDTPKPSGKIGDIIDWLFETGKDLTREACLQGASVFEYKGAKDEDKIYAHVLKGSDYFNALKKAKGKIVMDPDIHDKIMRLAMVLTTHNEFTNKFFFQPQESPIELQYQVPIVIKNVQGFNFTFKGLFDGLVINKKDKWVIPYDLKFTGYSPYRFKYEFLRWGYYIQAGLYRDLLLEEVRDSNSILYDYRVKNFHFIVASGVDVENPLIWRVNDDLHEICTKGGLIGDRMVRGWRQLVEDYFWHKENDKWLYPREIYEKNGIVDFNFNLETNEND